jgi:pyridoxine 5-phosphate synthase
VSLFIAAEPAQIDAAARIGAPVIELHTGAYCDFHAEGDIAASEAELARLIAGAKQAADLGLEVHMGHGLSYDNVAPIAAIPEVVELNIGHFLIGEAVFVGLEAAIAKMRAVMDAARA